ncbi:MAG: ABC transporter ATP-binding protein [Phycisphaerales bacterium]|nr:MAG: ABC transporter ATP-binding protein [Phycisphaerales bacterium]
MTTAIEANRLRYAYRDGREALKGFSLTVEPGESVGIIGPNGAGKTTLFLALIGIYRPQSGMLRVCGRDALDKRNLSEIRRRAGLVFQNTDDQLFSASVRDDVSFGPLNLELDADEVRRRVDTALQRVDAAPFAERVSHHLSAGEKRRVALACVLAMEPEILILDEPTNDLDPRARRETIRLIRSLTQTKLIASQDLEFILETCDRVAVLDEGRVVADGPARELLADRVIMEAHGLEVPPSLVARATPATCPDD